MNSGQIWADLADQMQKKRIFSNSHDLSVQGSWSIKAEISVFKIGFDERMSMRWKYGNFFKIFLQIIDKL